MHECYVTIVFLPSVLSIGACRSYWNLACLGLRGARGGCMCGVRKSSTARYGTKQGQGREYIRGQRTRGNREQKEGGIIMS